MVEWSTTAQQDSAERELGGGNPAGTVGGPPTKGERECGHRIVRLIFLPVQAFPPLVRRRLAGGWGLGGLKEARGCGSDRSLFVCFLP